MNEAIITQRTAVRKRMSGSFLCLKPWNGNLDDKTGACYNLGCFTGGKPEVKELRDPIWMTAVDCHFMQVLRC
jgi:hypothetical protein